MRKNRDFTKFEDWHSYDVQEKLGYFFDKDNPNVKVWTTVDGHIESLYLQTIEKLRLKLCDHNASWNETELMTCFIGPFLNTIDFEGKGFNIFFERFLSAKLGSFKVKGSVDGLVSKGVYEPILPYFFLHEYKRLKGTEADPLGQLLISMVAAQFENTNNKPIYGCYVIGPIWRFVLLENKTYSESQGYDATDRDEIQTIWLILNRTKAIITEWVNQDTEKNNEILP